MSAPLSAQQDYLAALNYVDLMKIDIIATIGTSVCLGANTCSPAPLAHASQGRPRYALMLHKRKQDTADILSVLSL